MSGQWMRRGCVLVLMTCADVSPGLLRSGRFFFLPIMSYRSEMHMINHKWPYLVQLKTHRNKLTNHDVSLYGRGRVGAATRTRWALLYQISYITPYIYFYLTRSQLGSLTERDRRGGGGRKFTPPPCYLLNQAT